MGIWDEVNTMEEMTDIHDRITQLESRCQQLEDICLRVASLQNGFYHTVEMAERYFSKAIKVKETRHKETMINFISLTHLYRRIDLIQGFYNTLKEAKTQPVQEELFQRIETMLHSVIESFNATLDILCRLSRRHAIVYLLSEDIPVALMIDEGYIKKYYLSED